MADSDREWEKIGRSEPYWGVTTHDECRMKNLTPEHKQEFFQFGERVVKEIFDTISSQINKNFEPSLGLDFGCGVGRLTIPLSKYCNKVIGVDVSSGMLTEARRNCVIFNVVNVDFVDNLSKIKEKVDIIITEYVLQHIDEKRGIGIIESLIEKLTPSGIACIHLPYYLETSPTRKAFKPLVYKSVFLQKMYNLLVNKDANAPFMLMNAYDMNKILKMLKERNINKLFLLNAKISFDYHATLFIEK